MPNLKYRVLEYLKLRSMPLPPAKVLLGLSGGLDSVALLHILQDLGFEVIAAHANYGLREAADADEAFCRELCQSLKIPFLSANLDAKALAALEKKGIQDAARQLRYAWFSELTKTHKLDHIALAHHADDQLETLWMSLLGGEASTLFKGIPDLNGAVFRPLLALHKSELEHYLKSRNQTWVEDASNASNAYDRNFIRNELVPLLAARFPGFEDVLLKKYERYQAQSEALDHFFLQVESAVEQKETNWSKLPADALRCHLPDAQIPIFLEWWAGRRWKGKQSLEVAKLWSAKSGAHIQIGDWRIQRSKEGLISERLFSATVEPLVWQAFPASGTKVNAGIWELDFEHLDRLPESLNASTLYIYMQRLDLPLVLRPPMEAERMTPLGMKGSKAIKDLLADDKQSLAFRNNALVLAGSRGVLALLPGRLAAIAAVPDGAGPVLAIHFHSSV